MHFIGLDVHRQFVAHGVQNAAGERLARGNIPATREALPQWAGAREAATFSGWIYDTLRPFAAGLAGRRGGAAELLAAQRARASRRASLSGLRDGEPIVRLGRPQTP